MKALAPLEAWLVVGSQALYGREALRQVEAHAREVADGLDAAPQIPVNVVFRGLAADRESIRRLAGVRIRVGSVCVAMSLRSSVERVEKQKRPPGRRPVSSFPAVGFAIDQERDEGSGRLYARERARQPRRHVAVDGA